MPKKRVSDTISQQRKARQDFLELKKMQAGEISASANEENELQPETFKGKMENFWFHFKWQTIAIIFSIAVLSVIISQCIAKDNWDMQVVYFTYSPILDEQIYPLAEYFEDICPDINGDGEVKVNIVNCSLSPDSNKQYNQSLLTKLQAMISAEPEAMLYITDSQSQTFFETEALQDFFATEQLSLSEDFYTATETDYYGRLPDGLEIAARKIEGTTLGKNEEAKKVYTAAEEVLRKLSQK